MTVLNVFSAGLLLVAAACSGPIRTNVCSLATTKPHVPVTGVIVKKFDR